MFTLWSVFWGLCLVVLINSGSVYGRITFKYLNCSVEDRNIVEILKCKLNMQGRNRVVANFAAKLKANILDIDVVLQLKRYYTSGWRPFLYKINFNMCDYLRNPKRFAIADVFLTYLKQLSNVNHTCPYKRGEQMIIKDFILDETVFRSRFPVDVGTYGVFSVISTMGKVVLKTAVTIEYSDYRAN